MSTDIKKHQSFAAGEKPSRAALAAAIMSINDVIPVANVTEATQVAVAIAASGQNLANVPVMVSRADARGLHRIEITYDPAGLVWAPASGIPTFASESAANDWASSNSSLLVPGDVARLAGGGTLTWSGTSWVLDDTGWIDATLQNAWINAAVGEEIKYRRLHGVTYLKGRGANGTGTTVFTLPEGFRPVSISRYVVPTSATAANPPLVTVNPNGVVVCTTGVQPNFAAIAFPADG